MSSSDERDVYNSSSSSDHGSESTPNYTLSALRQFMARKKLFVKTQFITSDDTIAFIRVYIESIGEDILVYFPSKYSVPRESGSIPAIDIIPYDLTDEDLLSINSHDEQESKGNYTELGNFDDLKDKDSYASDSYQPISIENNKEHQVRKSLLMYHKQLDKFRASTAHIKYKFSIMTNNVLSVINRHNEPESYLIKTTNTLVPDIIDSKTDAVIKIPHELYILIDLPSFFDKMDQISTEVIKVYRTFYAMLGRAHTKQTALAEYRFKHYNLLISRLVAEYNKNTKYLDLISSLVGQLEKSVEQENELIRKLDIINRGGDGATMSKDESKSFKLDKTERDLAKIREVKTKTTTLLHEIKTKHNAFLLTFDTTISTLCKNLREIEKAVGDLGLKMSDKIK